MNEEVIEETIEEMNEEFLEQPVVAPEKDTATKNSNIYGRFATVQELGKAYECLQSEFTRKSQQLAKLKHEATIANGERDTRQNDRDEIIRDYLVSVASQKRAPTVITTQGEIGFGVNPEPRTMQETERIAEHFFRTKGEIL